MGVCWVSLVTFNRLEDLSLSYVNFPLDDDFDDVYVEDI